MNDRVNRHKQHQDAKRIAAAPDGKLIKLKPTTCQACRKDAAMQQKPRLPDKSTFELTYNSMTGKWYGNLMIGKQVAGGPNDPHTFTEISSGVIGLLVKLDDAYRDSLTDPASPAPKPNDAPA